MNINATGGAPVGSYATLGAAFTAINNGVHTGQILVVVANNTNEGATQAVLNASGSGAASYTKVYITTTLANAVVSGAPATGNAVVKLNGADNVTINGATNASGTTRNLTIENTVAAATANTAAIWVSSLGAAAGATNDTIQNVIIRGNDAANTGATSTFGLYIGGATISTTGTGADNDNIAVLNNEFRRAWVGFYARGTAANALDNLHIRNNKFGSATAGEQIGRSGLDIQGANAAQVTTNDIGPFSTTSTVVTFGLEFGANTTNCVASGNLVHDIVNTGTTGTWGLNIASGTGNVLVNNMVYRIATSGASVTSTTILSSGIRINGGTNHVVAFNSVNLYGTTGATAAATSAGITITTTTATGLTIRNNAISNKMTHPVAGSKAYGVLVVAAYNFGTATSTINNNCYFLPANTATTTYAFGSTLATADFADLPAWQLFTGQEAASLPYASMAHPWAADDNLHATTFPNPLESGAVNLVGITTDYDAEIRQGNAGYAQVPAGTAPDIGADEFASTPGDFVPPAISAVSINPAGGQCNAVAHTVTATITDAGAVSAAFINYSLNGTAQTPIAMTPLGGGVYSGVIPASGSQTVAWFISATDNASPANTRNGGTSTYRDAFVTADAGPSDTACVGTPFNLVGGSNYTGCLKFTEISQFPTGTGATASPPTWLPHTGSEDYIEITNLSGFNLDLSGVTVFVVGGTTRTYTFANGTTLPSLGIAMLHVGSGTDNPANNFFNMGGTNNVLSSGTATGYYMKDPNGIVIDAVGTNGFTFSAATTGVTAADWSGTIASSSGRASVFRSTSDNNLASDWTISNTPSPLATLTTLNAGLTTCTSSMTWDGSPSANGILTLNPTVSAWHYFTITAAGCTAIDSAYIQVNPVPAAPAVLADTICGFDTLSLSASGTAGVFMWYDQASGGSSIYTGNPYMPILGATDTFYVELYDGCTSARTPVVATVTAADSISFSVSPNPACQDDIITLASGSLNPTYVVSWTGTLLGSLSGSSVTTTAVNDDMIYIEAIDAAGCRVVDTLESIVNTVGSVAVSSMDSVICLGDTAMIVGVANAAYLTGPITFTNNPVLTIPDGNPAGIRDTLVVSGLYPINMTDAMLQVCLDSITMTWNDDLDIFLTTPCGNVIELTTDNGSSGDNYINNCYSMSASASITTATAPMTGTFLPEDPLGFSEVNGCEANGNWVLHLTDDTGSDVATLHRWSITINVPNVFQSSWTATNGFTSTNDSIWDAPTSTTTYYLSLTDTLAGCTQIDSFTVAIAQTPTISVAGDLNGCAGGSTTLVASATGGLEPYSYLWTGGGTNDSLSVTYGAATSYVIDITDACGNNAADTLVVAQYDALSVTTSAGSAICEGDSATITATPVDGEGTYSYAWSNGNTTASITVSPTATTTYTVTVTDGCGTTVSGNTIITVNPLATAGFSFSPASPQAGQSVTFTNSSTNATSYAWNFGGLGTSTLASPSFTFPASGSVTVTLIATNSCGSDTITQNITVLVSVAENLEDLDLSVYPNPTRGQLALVADMANDEEVKISIQSMIGQVLIHEDLGLVGGQVRRDFDLSNLPNGIYLVKFETPRGQLITRVTVAK